MPSLLFPLLQLTYTLEILRSIAWKVNSPEMTAPTGTLYPRRTHIFPSFRRSRHSSWALHTRDGFSPDDLAEERGTPGRGSPEGHSATGPSLVHPTPWLPASLLPSGLLLLSLYSSIHSRGQQPLSAYFMPLSSEHRGYTSVNRKGSSAFVLSR